MSPNIYHGWNNVVRRNNFISNLLLGCDLRTFATSSQVFKIVFDRNNSLTMCHFTCSTKIIFLTTFECGAGVVVSIQLQARPVQGPWNPARSLKLRLKRERNGSLSLLCGWRRSLIPTVHSKPVRLGLWRFIFMNIVSRLILTAGECRNPTYPVRDKVLSIEMLFYVSSK